MKESPNALMHMYLDGTLSADNFFNRLHKSMYRELVNYCAGMIGNQTDAEDIVQTTFLKAYDHIDDLRTDSNMYAFMYKIATNLFLTEYRRQRRWRMTEICEEMPEEESDRAYVMLAAPESYAPDVMFERRELSKEILDAARRLPEEFRDPFLHTNVKGMQIEEYSELSGIPVGTVKSRAYRARQRLMRELLPVAEEYGIV